jgi:hypothetical protein
MKLPLSFISVFVVIAGMFSCKSDSGLDIHQLHKEWEVVGANREGKATETINGAYFTFTDQTVETNFMGEVMKNPYTIRKDVLEIGDPVVPYRIQYLDNDSLHLSATIRDFSFDFFLLEKKHEQ